MLDGRVPVHVTLRVREHVWNLRTERCFAVLREAMERAVAVPEFRPTALSIQGNHLHTMAEPGSAEALSQGVRLLKTEAAKGLNRLMGRCGPVFEEGRYHQHVLDTPREVRRALEYIRWNTWKHAKETGRPLSRSFVDPYTIGFFGDETLLPDRCQGMVVEPRAWLLCHGWRLGAMKAGAAVDAVARETRRRKARWPSPLPLFASMDAAGRISADSPVL